MRVILRDLAAVAGFGLFVVGCWWLSPAAALIVSGLLLVAGAVWGHANDPD